MASTGLDTLNSAMSFMRDPRESLDALKEFVTSPEAMKQLGAQVVATIETQVDEINEALDKGGDANAEDLGRKAGHTFSLVVGTIANGGSGAASKSVTLSRMGIDVSSKELEGLVTKVKANGLKNEIAQVEKLGRDSDVPVIDPIAESGTGTKTTDKTPLPSYYREDSSAGAAVTQADLPEGYTRVLNTKTGNFEVRSPTGDLQFPDSEGNLIPKDGGKLAQQKQAEERIAGAKGSAFAGKNIDDLSNAGKLLDPADKSGQLSLAGRALQKHGSREGSAFPSVKGSPSEINAQGQKIADEILSNPATTVTYKDTGRFGKVMDVIAPDGRGLRYDSNGKFIGLLEPPKP